MEQSSENSGRAWQVRIGKWLQEVQASYVGVQDIWTHWLAVMTPPSHRSLPSLAEIFETFSGLFFFHPKVTFFPPSKIDDTSSSQPCFFFLCFYGNSLYLCPNSYFILFDLMVSASLLSLRYILSFLGPRAVSYLY